MQQRATFHDNEDNSDLDSEGSIQSLDDILPIDWDDMSRVIEPVPAFLKAILTDIRDMVGYSETRFHGDYIQLRWTTADGIERQIFLNTPNEEEAEENQACVGKHWLSYENFGPGRVPVWTLFVELGVEKDHLDKGVHISMQFMSNPHQPHSEVLYDRVHVVTSLEQWNAEAKPILLHQMPELARRVENEVDFAGSAESTDMSE